MKVAIMQPYFLPYIGYWQLLSAVDVYVIYDDVNYIKGGFINRNNICLNQKPHWITLPLEDASSNKKINQISIKKDKTSVQKTIHHAYSKAPFFSSVKPLLEEILGFEDNNLASFVANSIKKIADYLDIKTKIIISSEIEKNNELKSQDKVIDLCHRLNATHYINAIGGYSLYSKEFFLQHGIDLKFLKVIHPEYKQFKGEFLPNLSIVDLLVFNSKKDLVSMMDSFTLVDK